MTRELDEAPEGFLRRWSRVKTETRESAAAPPPAPAPVAATPDRSDAADAPPELPPIEELTLESDFSGFFHPKVDEDLRRSALRKLFSDPHFNVMDGLDVYIDDYSKSEPIPAAMLASLKQAQRILEWAADTKDTHKEAGDAAANLERADEPGAVSTALALENAPLDPVPQPAFAATQGQAGETANAGLHVKP
jgi:hypothetical protein